MDYDALKREMEGEAYAGLSEQEVADALNARTIPVIVDVPTFDARGVLLGTGEWGALNIAAIPRQDDAPEMLQVRGIAITARDTLLHTETLETSRPQYMVAVTTMLGVLAQVGVIGEGTRDLLLSMTQAMRSRADELGLGVVTDQDVLTVRVTAERAASESAE